MTSTMTLNTRVHIVSKSGKKETITARELIARGTGSSFEAFQMLDEYEMLARAYKAEMRFKAGEKDWEDHLPFGAHLLPEDYQYFLYTWNKLITETTGWWNGKDRADFWEANPTHKAQWDKDHAWYKKHYAAEIKLVKAYQATHTMEDSEDEQYLPSLPPSPISVVESSEQPDTYDEDKLEAELPQLEPEAPQSIPQVFPVAQQLSEQPDTDGEDCDDTEDTEDAEHEPPTRLHHPIYTNGLWPSPLAKLFVQQMRGPTWTLEMRSNWSKAGNTEFKLTHDNCMRYLAYRMGRISLSKLMEMEPRDVHAQVIGKHFGVPGFYTKPFYY